MRSLLTALIVTLAAAALSGCANYTEPIGPEADMTAAERNFDTVWRASLDVLWEYNFTVDREDRRAGTITTEPLTGQQAGEFWRHDAATRQDLAESTIQTIYRQAKVTVSPTKGNKDVFQAVVEVQTFRSDRQDPQITSTSEALSLFRLPGDKTRKKQLLDYGKGEAADSMVPLGQDENLSRKMAEDINERTGQFYSSF